MEKRRFTKRVSHVADIPPTTQFIVLHDDSYSAMGHDYGPPDPPPSMETTYHLTTLAFDTEEELLEWITQNEASRSKKRFVAMPYKPLSVQSEIKIKLG